MSRPQYMIPQQATSSDSSQRKATTRRRPLLGLMDSLRFGGRGPPFGDEEDSPWMRHPGDMLDEEDDGMEDAVPLSFMISRGSAQEMSSPDDPGRASEEEDEGPNHVAYHHPAVPTRQISPSPKGKGKADLRGNQEPFRARKYSGAIHGFARSTGRERSEKLADREAVAKEQALWDWANLSSHDVSLAHIYSFYVGKGFIPVALENVLRLLTIAFVGFFSIYLFGCLDYSKLSHNGSLAQITVPYCFTR